MTQQILPEGTDSIIDDAAAFDEPEGTGGAEPDTNENEAEPTKPAPTAADARAAIGDAKAKIGETAAGLKGQATDKAREYALMGKDRATETLHNVSRMIDDAATTVDAQVGPQFGDYARQAADLVKGFATNLEGKDVDELFEQGREIVKKSPAIAIGAAAAIGFVLTRVIKAGLEPAIAAVTDAPVATDEPAPSGGPRA